MKIKIFSLFVFSAIMFFLIRFYNESIAPYTHYLEVNITYLTVVIVALLFVVTLLIHKERKTLLRTFFSLFLIVLIAGVSFWGVRPYTIIYNEVPKRMEILNSYFEEIYPERSWEIRKSESTFASHYLMLVIFEDEPKTIYLYNMDSDVVSGKKGIKNIGSYNLN